MTNPTSNFGWQMPTSTDLVTDLPADFAVFGQAVDTSMADLKGGTTGQILSKATATDMDFTWITNDVGDITAVTAGTGITGGGTTGAVTITNDMATTITAAGDIVVGTGSGTYDNLPIGTTAQVLTADTTVSPYKVKWAAPAAASYTWTSYTPVVKGGATTVTKTIVYAKYAQIDKLVFVQVSVVVTSAGAVNGAINISLPSGLSPTTQGGRFTRGTYMVTDAGVGFYTGTALITGDVVYGMSSAAGDYMGANTPAMTLANTDEISFQVVYEVA